MKSPFLRLSSLFTAFVMMLISVVNVMPARALGPNLVANNSVETVSAASTTKPDKWSNNKWGTNTTNFSYPTSGRTGTRSVKATVTSYTNGDAKWYANAIAVTPGQSYTYSDYYQSTVVTQVVLAEINASGAYAYKSLANAPISAAWKAYTATFTPAATTAKVEVYHLIKKVGSLTLDDVSLALTNGTTPPPADNTLPTVALTAPAANATVSGTVNLTATATDNVAVTKVDFFIDGATTPLTSDASSPYSASWNTTTTTNGNHTVTATAFDAAGNKATSTRTVTVSNVVAPPADTTAPTVALTAPAANASVSGTVNLTATASDNVSVTKVEFSIDGSTTPLSTDTTTPYATTWDTATAANGTHTVSAIAYDAAGNKTTSTNTVTVVNTTPPVEVENLFANNSFVAANGADPASWLKSNWGTNTSSFTYETTGRTDGRSASTTVTTHTTGDAKWYPTPVTVTPSKNYLYRDYYKANVPTRIVAAYIDATGVYTYQDLVTAQAAADWTQVSAAFTTPATAAQVTIFHLIDGVGKLTIDDVELVIATQTPPSTTIPANGSVENGTTTPTGWQTSSWGTNAPSFQYVSGDAQEGTKSIKVTMSNYVSGDAKWFFDPTSSITAGQQYRFTTWYKGTIAPHAVALYVMADGTEQYLGLPSPLTISSTTWTKYSDTFNVPAGAKAVSLFLYVNSNGWVQTDNYSITPYTPNGFNRGLVSLTFDDGHEDNATTALPIMTQFGFKSTQCYATSFIEGQSQAVINGVLAFRDAGHEICSHTVTHPFMTTLDTTTLNYELSHSKAYLESITGQTIRNFASPYGDYNANVEATIAQYYQSHRTVDEGFNSKDNYDLYRLRVQNILDTTTAAQVKAWVEQAQADKTWLILVYHRVGANPGPYDTTPALFTQHLQAIQQTGAPVLTYQDALVETRAQL